ncbi:MAG TPA: TetR/AcrR family transcriptional regulator [Magnetospirillaceae bacterium]|jgi:AcrR family transcriptional regulator
MSSQNASVTIKEPRRKRGRERVAALLDAAAQVFAEKGYDAATMAEIAARAGAAIGSLYQFFPNKELIAGALRSTYGDELVAKLEALCEQAAAWKSEELADRLVDAMLDFHAEHPAFTALVEAHAGLYDGAAEVREQLRGAIRAMLLANVPQLGADQAQAMAIVALHTMKAAAAMNAEAKLTRNVLLDEMRAMLRLYVMERIAAAQRA